MKNLTRSASRQISADIHVPPDSPWFCGHFPEEPILPGIAQLGMAYDAINTTDDRQLKITRISRVRFRQTIRPDDRLTLAAWPQKGSGESYVFRLTIAGEVACSGIMAFET